MAEIRVVLDQAALGRLLRGPDGPIYRDINQKGLRVQQEARRLVSGPLLNVRTGKGRSGITMKMATIRGEAAAVVSTSPETGYMYLHHEGLARGGRRRPFLLQALSILRGR